MVGARTRQEARETIRLANKIIMKRASHEHDISDGPHVSGRETEKKTSYGLSAHGLRNPHIPVFSGDNYEDWKVTFDAFVGEQNISDKFKMIQIKTCLAGDTLKLISRYYPTEAGYTKARSELERKYGGVTRRNIRQLEEIRSMRPVRPGQCDDLDHLTDRIQSLVISLEGFGCAADLSETSAYYILVKEKLPASYVNNFKRWQQDQINQIVLYSLLTGSSMKR